MFLFDLALALGGMTVAELENRIGSGELREWAIYRRHNPFGQWRDNYHAGLIASLIWNTNRGKNQEAKTEYDFIFRTPEQEKDRQTKKTLAALQTMAKHK